MVNKKTLIFNITYIIQVHVEKLIIDMSHKKKFIYHLLLCIYYYINIYRL